MQAKCDGIRIGVVSMWDGEVTAPTAARVLTLVTCHPFDAWTPSEERFVVRCVAAC